ncbi:PEGA domain-containing protein [Algoriphagus aquatilis]|uniref:PEGA domain-containing protein n=1 Tax=Algoriphagus aquatilis TaxID=490186 RepID=A0ABW0C1I5_9BACT
MKKIPLLLVSIILMSGCATIFTGTKDRITFNSNPSGAIIYKDGVELCTTPCTYKVKRSINDTDIEFKLDGYQTRVITLDKEFNVISIINLGNLLGWGIDALSGAVMKYDRKTYDITLSPNKTASILEPSRINIDTQKNTVELIVQE